MRAFVNALIFVSLTIARSAALHPVCQIPFFRHQPFLLLHGLRHDFIRAEHIPHPNSRVGFEREFQAPLRIEQP